MWKQPCLFPLNFLNIQSVFKFPENSKATFMQFNFYSFFPGLYFKRALFFSEFTKQNQTPANENPTFSIKSLFALLFYHWDMSSNFGLTRKI